MEDQHTHLQRQRSLAAGVPLLENNIQAMSIMPPPFRVTADPVQRKGEGELEPENNIGSERFVETGEVEVVPPPIIQTKKADNDANIIQRQEAPSVVGVGLQTADTTLSTLGSLDGTRVGRSDRELHFELPREVQQLQTLVHSVRQKKHQSSHQP